MKKSGCDFTGVQDYFLSWVQSLTAVSTPGLATLHWWQDSIRVSLSSEQLDGQIKHFEGVTLGPGNLWLKE